MRFLVTGGAGFIGSHLCEKLVDENHFVVCLDNFNSYYDPEIKRRNVKTLLSHPRFQLAEIDILQWRRLTSLFENESFDVIVHLAARAGVRPSIRSPKLYQKVNIQGTVNLLELAKKFDVQKFVMASSSSVYGNNKKVPFHEDDSVDHPVSPYAATKKACELIGHTYSSLYNLPVTCLRFFTVYGPRQRPDMAIHKFTRCINNDLPITMFGDGTSRRDYTYISDILEGIDQAIQRCKGFRVYNLGESQTINLKDLIQLLEKSIGKKAKIKQLPDQPGDVRVTFADITRAQKELNYRPSVPVEEGIPKFIQWYTDQMGVGE